MTIMLIWLLQQKFNPALTAAENTVWRWALPITRSWAITHLTGRLGFQNGFSYKKWELSVYSYFRWGQTISYNMLGWYQPNGFATTASPSRTIPNLF